MAAWNGFKANALIAKNGKKQGQLKMGLIPHKNKDVKAAAVESTMSRQWKPNTVKFKRPEGIYEIQFGVSFKAQLKTKFHKKKPLPPTCPMDSCAEFTEIRIFVDKITLPEYHTLEIGVFTNIVQNAGTPKDMDPEVSFQFDIKTGHMVLGKWHMKTKSIHFCAATKSKGHIY